MYNFDPYNVLLVIATNIPVLLMTVFVLQRHMFLTREHKHQHVVNKSVMMHLSAFYDLKA